MSSDLLALDRTRHLVPGARPDAGPTTGSWPGADDTAQMPRVPLATAPSTDPAAAPHWPALDGLRGLAVAGVVAYHLGWISGGFLGVDLFFALSGFLITTLLVREHRATGGIDLLAFWGRRFRRLLPAVMALIAGVLVWVAWFGTPAEQAGARGDARWAIPYLANWHLVSAARDYWASATDASVFTHLWSLAIEEQFYVVWPVVAWWALRGRGGERRLARITAVGFVASALAMVLLAGGSSPSRVYLGTDTRAAALFVGALVALNPIHRRLRALSVFRQGRAERLVVVICVVLAVSWAIGGDHLDLLLHGGLLLHSTLAALAVGLIAVAGAGTRSVRPLEQPWLTWLGRRSYGIYLWHWPVIVLAEPRWTALPAPARDLAMIALSLALAECSYRWLEHPIRRRVAWAAGTRASWATLAVTALAVAAAVAAPSGKGHVAGFEFVAPAVTVAPHASTAEDSAVAASTPAAALGEPAVEPTPDEVSPVTEPIAPSAADPAAVAPDAVGSAAAVGAGTATSVLPTLRQPPAPTHTVAQVLWIGDSVAADLAPALTAAFATSGVTWIDAAGDGLRLTPGGGVDPVELYTEVLAEHTFDTVVVQLSYWDSPADLDQLRSSLGWFRDQVIARGADLVLITPPPVRADLVDPGLTRQIEVAAELVAAGEGHVHLVDSTPAWGPTMAFDIDGDGAPDRKPDGVHVCPQGAARFAAWLVGDLGLRFGGVTVAAPETWVSGDWTSSDRYDTPAGACVALG